MQKVLFIDMSSGFVVFDATTAKHKRVNPETLVAERIAELHEEDPRWKIVSVQACPFGDGLVLTLLVERPD